MAQSQRTLDLKPRATNHETLETRLAALPTKAYELLLLLYRLGPGSISWPELIYALHGGEHDSYGIRPVSRAHVDAIWDPINRLVRDRLIVAVASRFGGRTDQELLVPDAVRMMLAGRAGQSLRAAGHVGRIAAPIGGDAAAQHGAAGSRVGSNAVTDAVFDLTTLVAAILDAPRPLTAQQYIYKREQAKLGKMLRRQEPVPKGNTPYAPHMRCLVEYALRDGLLAVVEPHPGSLNLVATPLAHMWAQSPLAWRRGRYVAFWWQWLLGAMQFGRPIAEICATLPAGSRLQLAPVLAFCEWSREPSHYAQRRLNEMHYVSVLEGSGLVRITSPKDQPYRAGRWIIDAIEVLEPPAALPALDQVDDRDESYVIQPNFEVLISQEAPARRIWQLYRCAELVRSDKMMTFRLTRDSVMRGLDDGLSGPELLTQLEAGSRHALAQNVRFTLEQWLARAGRSRFTSGVLLECDDPTLADELSQIAALKPHLGRRVGPQHFFVPHDRVDTLRRELEKQDHAPLPGMYALADDGRGGTRLMRVNSEERSTDVADVWLEMGDGTRVAGSPLAMGASAAARLNAERAGRDEAAGGALWERYYGGDVCRPVAVGGPLSLTPLESGDYTGERPRVVELRRPRTTA